MISEETILELIRKSGEFVRTHNISECRNFIESYVEKVIVYCERVEVLFKVHVPDGDNGEVVPLKGGEEIQVIRHEYQSLASADSAMPV
jgi:site-specific DNA recombinase